MSCTPRSRAANWCRLSQGAVNFSFTPIELGSPDPFGVTVVLMKENGYSVRLTEALAR